VQNSATKGIQGMQAVSNLPISAWLTAAARRGFLAVQIRQRKPRAVSRSVAIPVRFSVFLR